MPNQPATDALHQAQCVIAVKRMTYAYQVHSFKNVRDLRLHRLIDLFFPRGVQSANFVDYLPRKETSIRRLSIAPIETYKHGCSPIYLASGPRSPDQKGGGECLGPCAGNNDVCSSIVASTAKQAAVS